MGLHEKGAMKYRQAPGLWRGISLVEGPDGRVQGIQFGEVGLDLEAESAYQRDRLEERRFRLRRRHVPWEI